MAGIKYCNIEIVKPAIKNKADVNSTDENGLTPLMIASGYNYFEIVQLLCDAKADVNAHLEDGTTAPHFAAGGYKEDEEDEEDEEKEMDEIVDVSQIKKLTGVKLSKHDLYLRKSKLTPSNNILCLRISKYTQKPHFDLYG